MFGRKIVLFESFFPVRVFFQSSFKIFDKYDRELGYRYSREFEDGKAAFNRNAQLKSSN